MIDHRLGLDSQGGAPGAREPVVAGTPVIPGHAPLRRDEFALFHAMQRLEQRRIHDIQPAARSLLEPADDLEAVHRPPRERLEHEDIQGSFE